MLPKEQLTISHGNIPRKFTFRKLMPAFFNQSFGFQQFPPLAVNGREINLLRERQCIVGTAARCRVLRQQQLRPIQLEIGAFHSFCPLHLQVGHLHAHVVGTGNLDALRQRLCIH